MQYLSATMFETSTTFKIILVTGIALAWVLLFAFRIAAREADLEQGKPGLQGGGNSRRHRHKVAYRHRRDGKV